MRSVQACPPGSVGLPLLEVVNIPFYGWRNIAVGANRLTYFERAIGAADAAVPSGTGVLSERETNFLKGSSFPTPTQNTLYSFNSRFNLDAAYDDIRDLMEKAYWTFKLGPKFYATVPLVFIPGGAQVIGRVTAAAENVTYGLESNTLAYDVTVPEQVITPEGKCIDSPERVPMFIPSEQILKGTLVVEGNYAGAAALDHQMVGNSFLRREVG